MIKKRMNENIYEIELTSNGTNGAIKAPIRATVDAEPTAIDRITVGIISAVCT